ncbi:helix-turn-helix domain-containing protein [Aquimarina algiphila]|uniref:helix-turn-helix domain-containing protein n=1 Tax=Aquimarina algiphila TaxID=2047982 RepID=UPI0024939B39|nr:helix-turn-helix domain-containing protein [Aquimarina algiphila]
MRLAQRKTELSLLFFGLILLISVKGYSLSFGVDIKNESESSYVSISSIKNLSNNDKSKTTFQHNKVLDKDAIDSTYIYRELAFSYANANESELACEFIEKYIESTLDVTFVGHSYFDQISTSKAHIALANKYLKQFGWWAIFCFYVAFVGFFLSVVINFRKRSDRVANLLMSCFVLLHSCFMIHMALYFMNYEYYLPHTLYLFTTFSYLYGPLIFFYFKRVTEQYKFKLTDLLHLLPTIFLVILLLPIYLLPGEEKLRMVIYYERPYLTLISISKLTSLLVYGVLVVRLYIKSLKSELYVAKIVKNWQRNIVLFCSIYILSYAIYAILNMSHIGSGFLFNFQVASIAVMVLYVSYSAFVQPSLFGNLKIIVTPPVIQNAVVSNNKYKKSGLTQSLSLELKSKLLFLLNEEKIYKQNDITLQRVSELLETTRHNTSQVINEHFDLNFFELINKYRIEEAKELLKGERYKGFNIIDVAYEVGFNNKVTFNKSFKKYNQITPSEYLKLFVA